MKKVRKLMRSGKGWLFLLVALLAAAGIFVSVGSDGDSGTKPGSDVLGSRIDPKADPSGVSMGKKPQGDTAPAGNSGQTSSSGGSDSNAVSPAASPGIGDTTPPPKPVITDAPDEVTFAVDAHFRFTDSEAGVTFQCKLDGEAAESCNKGDVDYKKLSTADHVFQVWAIDKAGNPSGVASYRWTILIKKDFGISGGAGQVLYPGVSTKLNLRISNPFNFAIRVVSLSVTAKDAPGCPATNLETTGASFSRAVVVPANSARSLSALVPAEDWPQLQLLNTNANQDSCKNVEFALNYEGTATKA
ncbi:MAG: hypothetical protein ACRD0C_08760 [Acidimicrobiia bacterium]